MIISAAGFGHRIDWENEEVPPGHNLSFKRSVEIISSGILLRLVCPKWIFEWAPTEKIREARDGFAEFRVSPLHELDRASVSFGGELMSPLQSYLAEMINERKFSDEKGGKRDLLSNLVDANEELCYDGEQRLGEDELIGKRAALNSATRSFKAPRSGNIFMFYLAGHEVRAFQLAQMIILSQLRRRRQDIPFVSP